MINTTNKIAQQIVITALLSLGLICNTQAMQHPLALTYDSASSKRVRTAGSTVAARKTLVQLPDVLLRAIILQLCATTISSVPTEKDLAICARNLLNLGFIA